jgi:hypothetical protein
LITDASTRIDLLDKPTPQSPHPLSLNDEEGRSHDEEEERQVRNGGCPGVHSGPM